MPARSLATLATLCTLLSAACAQDERRSAGAPPTDDSGTAATAGTSIAARRATVDAPAPPATRTIVRLASPRWTRGGDESDVEFRAPSAIAADAAQLYLLDDATRAITALDGATGRTRWTNRSHAGLASRTTAIVIAARPAEGGLAIADAGTNRIVHLTAHDGRIERSAPLTDDAHPAGICPRPDGSTLMADPTAGARLLGIPAPPESTARSTISFPWPALRGASPLVTQAWLAPVADGTACALALMVGEGLALLDESGFRWRQRYVEPAPLPTPLTTTSTRGDTTITKSSLATTALAANALGAVGHYIAVAFEGQSPARSRVVDLYDARDGRYAYSLEADAPVRAVAGNRDGLLVLLTRRAGRPMLAAYQLPATPDPR